MFNRSTWLLNAALLASCGSTAATKTAATKTAATKTAATKTAEPAVARVVPAPAPALAPACAEVKPFTISPWISKDGHVISCTLGDACWRIDLRAQTYAPAAADEPYVAPRVASILSRDVRVERGEYSLTRAGAALALCKGTSCRPLPWGDDRDYTDVALSGDGLVALSSDKPAVIDVYDVATAKRLATVKRSGRGPSRRPPRVLAGFVGSHLSIMEPGDARRCEENLSRFPSGTLIDLTQSRGCATWHLYAARSGKRVATILKDVPTNGDVFGTATIIGNRFATISLDHLEVRTLSTGALEARKPLRDILSTVDRRGWSWTERTVRIVPLDGELLLATAGGDVIAIDPETLEIARRMSPPCQKQ